MKTKLIETLGNTGNSVAELKGSEGGSILVLPLGGRVLGLFTQDDNENFFWVNPALTDKTNAMEFFKGNGWKNTGGDRTWVGPEVDIFIKDVLKAWDTYEIPSALDPGKYTLQKYGNTLRLFIQPRLILHRLHKEIEFDLSKEIYAVPNPLRNNRATRNLTMELYYIGYEQITALNILSEIERGVCIDIWNLIQLPAGGKLLIPTIGEAKSRLYFGSMGTNHLHVTPNYIQITLDARKQYKIGIKAASLIGRAGYLRHVKEDIWTLVVRNFFINPSGEYVDVPWDDERDFGYAFQCYNDDGSSGGFGELEYHTPAIGYGTGVAKYLDYSQVWAFRGRKKRINEVCEHLLRCKIE